MIRVRINRKIYAIGGAMPPSPVVSTPTIQEYAPVQDTWVLKTDMQTAKVTLSTSTVKGKIYAIGGMSLPILDGLSTVEEYTPPFSVSPQGKLATTWGEVKQGR